VAVPARANRHEWYRRRAIQANVSPVRLRLDHVIPWRPDRLLIDPWTVLRLARYRRRDVAPPAVWDATRAMAVRAGGWPSLPPASGARVAAVARPVTSRWARLRATRSRAISLAPGARSRSS
jgi:hypothetical protein